jgi:peptide deformylase
MLYGTRDMILPITTIPAHILRTPTRKLTKRELSSPVIQKLIDDMLATMPAANGVGLAAPQVNQSLRITVIAADKKPLIVVNGNIIEATEEMEYGEEGCLSIPGVYGVVPRHARIRVTYLDRYGKKITLRTQGLLARVFQHEIDHLDGILFVDRTSKFTTPLTDAQRKAFGAFKADNATV